MIAQSLDPIAQRFLEEQTLPNARRSIEHKFRLIQRFAETGRLDALWRFKPSIESSPQYQAKQTIRAYPRIGAQYGLRVDHLPSMGVFVFSADHLIDPNRARLVRWSNGARVIFLPEKIDHRLAPYIAARLYYDSYHQPDSELTDLYLTPESREYAVALCVPKLIKNLFGESPLWRWLFLTIRRDYHPKLALWRAYQMNRLDRATIGYIDLFVGLFHETRQQMLALGFSDHPSDLVLLEMALKNEFPAYELGQRFQEWVWRVSRPMVSFKGEPIDLSPGYS